MTEEESEKTSPTVIDAETGQVLGNNKSFEAQRAVGRIVDEVTTRGIENETLRVLDSKLREERQRLAVEAGKRDVESMAKKPSTATTPIKKSRSFFGLRKKS